MTQTTYASGTQTATIGTEHFLSSPNAAGNYALCLNLANMANGDILEVRAYKVAASGDSVQPLWFYGFYDAQPSINTVVLSDIVPNSLTDTNAVRFSIKQTHGTGRAYVWSVMQENDTASVSVSVPTVEDIRTEMDANSTKLAHLDADISTRLAAGDYTAPLSTTDVENSVWDADIGSHFVVNSFGEYLTQIITQTITTLINQVWDNATFDHTDPDSFGYFVVSILPGLMWEELTANHTTTDTFGELVGGLTSGGGSGDWTSTEKEQIRYRLGLDGTIDTPSATPDLATQTSVDAIKAQSDQLVFTGGRIDASVGAYQSGLAPLQPTVAGRTADISTTGEIGLDFDNIKDATTPHTLTNITVPEVSTAVNVTNNNDKTGYDLSGGALSSINGEVDTALADVGLTSTVTGRIDAAISTRSTLTAANVWAYVIEGTYTAAEFMRGMAAALMGKVSGAAGTTVTIRDVSDTKDRIIATVDENGNRSSVTKDLS